MTITTIVLAIALTACALLMIEFAAALMRRRPEPDAEPDPVIEPEIVTEVDDPVAQAVKAWAASREVRLPAIVAGRPELAYWLASLRSHDRDRVAKSSTGALEAHMSCARQIAFLRPWPTADERAGRARPTWAQLHSREQFDELQAAKVSRLRSAMRARP